MHHTQRFLVEKIKKCATFRVNTLLIADQLIGTDGREEGLIERKRQLSKEVIHLREKYESLMAQFPNLRFEYT